MFITGRNWMNFVTMLILWYGSFRCNEASLISCSDQIIGILHTAANLTIHSFMNWKASTTTSRSTICFVFPHDWIGCHNELSCWKVVRRSLKLLWVLYSKIFPQNWWRNEQSIPLLVESLQRVQQCDYFIRPHHPLHLHLLLHLLPN